jgi:hypothetical protein
MGDEKTKILGTSRRNGGRGTKGQRNICNNAVPTRESGMNRMADAVDQECSIESRRDEGVGAWRGHHEKQLSRRNNPNRSKSNDNIKKPILSRQRNGMRKTNRQLVLMNEITVLKS